METKSFSLPHQLQYPEAHSNASGLKHPTILALHGRGSNEEDLIGLAPYLPQDLLWISPRGPFTLGPGSYEWFQITQIGKPDPIRLANALHTLDQFINEIMEEYPIDRDHFYLLGFSQGTIMSISYTLTQPQRIKGVIAQSGYVPLESGLEIDETGIQRKPILLTHGMQDPLLPVELARRSRDVLQKWNVDLEYHEFNMAHQVTAESLAVVSIWLEKQLRL